MVLPHHVKGSGDDGRHIAGEPGRGLECPEAAASGAIRGGAPGRVRRAVGNDLPARRGLHAESKGALQVGLVEAGEEAVGIERLELGVQVNPAVHRVFELGQAGTGVLVGAAAHHVDHVALRQAQKRDPSSVECAGWLRPAVDLDPIDGGGQAVHEAGHAGGSASKPDRGVHAEGLVPTSQVEADLVVNVGKESRSGARLVAGEIVPCIHKEGLGHGSIGDLDA